MSAKEINNLKKQFQALQEDWDSYKSSIPRRHRSPLLGRHDFPNEETLEFSESSNSSTSSGEISISSIQEPVHIVGKIVGKNLLEELEAAKSDADDDRDGTTPGLSKCSSVLIQEDDRGDVDDDEGEEEDRDDEYSNADDEDEEGEGVNDTSCVVKIGLFFSSILIAFIGFVLIGLGFHEDDLSETDDFIVPT